MTISTIIGYFWNAPDPSAGAIEPGAQNAPAGKGSNGLDHDRIQHSTDVNDSLSAKNEVLSDAQLRKQIDNPSGHAVADIDEDDEEFFSAEDDDDEEFFSAEDDDDEFFDFVDQDEESFNTVDKDVVITAIPKPVLKDQDGIDKLAVPSDKSDNVKLDSDDEIDFGFVHVQSEKQARDELELEFVHIKSEKQASDELKLGSEDAKKETQYSVKEQRKLYNELLALRNEIGAELEGVSSDIDFTFRGSASATGAARILDGIKTFEMATPQLPDVLSQARTEERAAQINTLNGEIQNVYQKIAHRLNDDTKYTGAIMKDGKPYTPDNSWKASFENLGDNVHGALSGTKKSLVQATVGGAGAWVTSWFGGLTSFIGYTAGAAVVLDAAVSLPQNIADEATNNFMARQTAELKPKLAKLRRLEAEQNVQQTNVERVRISIHERKIQKNVQILEIRRLNFELGIRALRDSSAGSAILGQEKTF